MCNDDETLRYATRDPSGSGPICWAKVEVFPSQVCPLHTVYIQHMHGVASCFLAPNSDIAGQNQSSRSRQTLGNAYLSGALIPIRPALSASPS